MNRLTITPRAEADLEEIADFVARDDGVESVRILHGARKIDDLL